MTEYIDRQALEAALNHRLSYLTEEYSEFDRYTTGYGDAVLAVEDITGTHADPYHYLIEFHTEFPVSVDVKP